VGLLTGFAGVGGGFALVPALGACWPFADAAGQWPKPAADNHQQPGGPSSPGPLAAASLPLGAALLAGGAIAPGWAMAGPRSNDRKLRRRVSRALLIGSALLSGMRLFAARPQRPTCRADRSRRSPTLEVHAMSTRTLSFGLWQHATVLPTLPSDELLVEIPTLTPGDWQPQHPSSAHPGVPAATCSLLLLPALLSGGQMPGRAFLPTGGGDVQVITSSDWIL